MRIGVPGYNAIGFADASSVGMPHTAKTRRIEASEDPGALAADRAAQRTPGVEQVLP